MDSHIDNTLNELKKLPQSTDENITKIMNNIQEELTKGWEGIANSQKIKMADRSENSWGMVEAYERDELVDDSADEKQMKKPRRKLRRVPQRGGRQRGAGSHLQQAGRAGTEEAAYLGTARMLAGPS